MSMKPISAANAISKAGSALGEAPGFNQKLQYGLGNSALSAISSVEQAKERAASWVANAQQDKWSSIFAGGLGGLTSVAGGLAKNWSTGGGGDSLGTSIGTFAAPSEVRDIAAAGYGGVVVDPSDLRGVNVSLGNPYGW